MNRKIKINTKLYKNIQKMIHFIILALDLKFVFQIKK